MSSLSVIDSKISSSPYLYVLTHNLHFMRNIQVFVFCNILCISSSIVALVTAVKPQAKTLRIPSRSALNSNN
jgi:hypothetical protein